MQAINTCQQATKFKYKNPSFYIQLGNLQLLIGDVDSALNTYQQAIKLNPNEMKRVFAHLGDLLQAKAEKIPVPVV